MIIKEKFTLKIVSTPIYQASRTGYSFHLRN